MRITFKVPTVKSYIPTEEFTDQPHWINRHLVIFKLTKGSVTQKMPQECHGCHNPGQSQTSDTYMHANTCTQSYTGQGFSKYRAELRNYGSSDRYLHPSCFIQLTLSRTISCILETAVCVNLQMFLFEIYFNISTSSLQCGKKIYYLLTTESEYETIPTSNDDTDVTSLLIYLVIPISCDLYLLK